MFHVIIKYVVYFDFCVLNMHVNVSFTSIFYRKLRNLKDLEYDLINRSVKMLYKINCERIFHLSQKVLKLLNQMCFSFFFESKKRF